MSTRRHIAVVDIGSNSTCLFCCEGSDGRGGLTGGRRSRVTGLRRGADPDGSLTTDALARLHDCLCDYADAIREFQPARIVVAGTSAVRDAPNQDEVATLCDEVLGARLRVLSGAAEAGLAYRGAVGGLRATPRAVVDIGGGSTEIIGGGNAGPSGIVSLEIGTIRCTAGAMAADPPGEAAAAALGDAIRAHVARADPSLGPDGGAVIGVAGTFVALAALDLGRYSPEAVESHPLSRAALARWSRDLSRMTVAERRLLPGFDPARAEVIGAGAVIAAATADALDATEVVIRDRSLLDGMAFEALDLPQSRSFS